MKWTETAYERGSLAGSSRWTAILSVEVKQPATAEGLRKNPLGLYVDAIDWSKELDSAEPKPAAPAPEADRSLPLGSPLDPGIASGPPRSPSTERTSR